MNALFIIGPLWIVVGSIFAGWYDDQEMKKHVPFGEAPALVSLETMRIFSFLLLTAIGPAILLSGVLVAFVQTIYVRFHLMRARRRLRETCRKLGPVAESLLDDIEKHIKER